jgi:hypothetical protein
VELKSLDVIHGFSVPDLNIDASNGKIIAECSSRR